jgi:hypothetical protein
MQKHSPIDLVAATGYEVNTAELSTQIDVTRGTESGCS